jgi:hypothetical protein
VTATTYPNTHEQLTIDTAAEILRRFGPDPEPIDPEYPETKFWEWACEGMLECKAKWRQRGDVFAWIDEKPAWVPAVHWYLGILEDPEKPGKRRFRLELIGGGQIRVTENFKLWRHAPMGLFCYKTQLQVQAHTDDDVLKVVRNGVLSGGKFCEMATCAVVFPRGTPQEIADRTAATLRLIDAASVDGRDNFYALLAHGEQCGCCGRPLKDEISKLVGVGPDCARTLRLPHTARFCQLYPGAPA